MADYVGVLADLKARLAQLDTERAALDAERAEVDTLIAGVQRLIARRSGAPSPIVPTQRQAPRPTPKTMPEAVVAYLSAAPIRTHSTREFQDGVLALGMKPGNNIRGHVYNTLDRLSRGDGPIRRHSNGRWSLRAWNLPEGEHNTNHTNDLLQSAR